MTDDPRTDAERLRDLERDVRDGPIYELLSGLVAHLVSIRGDENTIGIRHLRDEMDTSRNAYAAARRAEQRGEAGQDSGRVPGDANDLDHPDAGGIQRRYTGPFSCPAPTDEPAGEAAAPGPYSTVHTPDLAERVEMARAFVDANSPQCVAPTDEPSEEGLRELAAELLFVHKEERAWTKEDCHRFIRDNPTQPEAVRLLKRARIAWRWCRARMAAAPPPATVEEIAGIIDRYVSSRELWTSEEAAREIAARIPVPAVPAEIVERLPHPDKTSDENTYEEWNAIGDLLTWARSQSAPAPDLPAEIVELAKAVVQNLPSTPHMDLVRGSYPTTLAKLEFAADFARQIVARAPAPDPRAAEERKL